MADNNPINYSDLFDFGDKSEIQSGVQGIKDLRKAYQEFYDTVSKGQLKRLSEQEKDLSKVKKELEGATKSLSIAEKQHQTVLLANLKAAEALAAAEAKLRKEKEDAIAANNKVKTTVESLSAEYRRLRVAYEAAFRSGDKDAMAKIATDARRVDAEIKNMNAALRATKPAFKAAAGSYAELDARTKQLVADLKQLPGGMNSTSVAAQRMKKEIFENTKQLKQFDAEMNHNFRNVGNYRSALGGLGDSLKQMAMTYISIHGAIMAVNAAFDQALKSDAVRTSLEFTFGSVDLADAKLEQLLQTANRLGINYNGLTQSYKSFIGAVIASNYDLQSGERIFNAVAGASSRLKLSAEDTEGALRALQQMISKGNVQAEELRGQLGERIPGAFSIAARAMGVTERELNKMLEKGEVLAAELLPKLAQELETTFALDNTEKVEGLAAAWNRLTNVFAGTVAESTRLGDFFESVVSGIANISAQIIGAVNSNSWNEFWARMFSFETGEAIASIESSMERAGIAINNSLKLDLANASVKDLSLNFEELKIAHERVSKALDIFKEKVNSGDLTEKGQYNIAALSKQVDVLFGRMQQVQRFIPEKTADATPVLTQAQIDAAARKAEAAQRKAEQRAKQAQTLANNIAKANADLAISEAELQYTLGSQSLDDKIAFENEKLRILNESYDQRLKLYAKDSKEYKDLLADKNQTEISNLETIQRAREQDAQKQEREREQELRRVEKFNAAKAKADQAQVDVDLAKREGEIAVGVANRTLDPAEANEQLYQARKAVLEKEIEDKKAAMGQLTEMDEDYHTIREDMLKAEKDLINERTEYEIAKAEEVADRRKQIQEQILEWSTELAEIGEEVAGIFFDRRIERLEAEKENELALAGDNAEARERIEENYHKKISQEKRKAAIADKAAAVIQIAINTAAAVMKVTAQTGVLAPFIIPGIIALGAVQAAIVAAKPIPKFARGTRNAPEGLAIVGEEGSEAIEENGRVRFSGPKPELTYLKKGAKVYTANETKQRFNYEDMEDKRFGDAMLESLLAGTGVVSDANHIKQTALMADLVGKALTPDQIYEAMQKAVNKIPIQQLFVDEKGARTYNVRKNQKIQDQNARNSFKGLL